MYSRTAAPWEAAQTSKVSKLMLRMSLLLQPDIQNLLSGVMSEELKTLWRGYSHWSSLLPLQRIPEGQEALLGETLRDRGAA